MRFSTVCKYFRMFSLGISKLHSLTYLKLNGFSKYIVEGILSSFKWITAVYRFFRITEHSKHFFFFFFFVFFFCFVLFCFAVFVVVAKTQISLGLRQVWSGSSLCTQWVAKDPSFLHADSKESDQTARMPRPICYCWAHMRFCWFCHADADMLSSRIRRNPFLLSIPIDTILKAILFTNQFRGQDTDNSTLYLHSIQRQSPLEAFA